MYRVLYTGDEYVDGPCDFYVSDSRTYLIQPSTYNGEVYNKSLGIDREYDVEEICNPYDDTIYWKPSEGQFTGGTITITAPEENTSVVDN